MLSFVELIPLAVGGIELVAVVSAAAVALVVIAGVVLYTPLYGIFDSLKRRGGVLGFIVNLAPFGWVFNPASKWINDQITKYITQFGGELIKGITPLGHALWSVVGVCWRFIYVATEMFGYLTDQLAGTNQRTQAALAAERAHEEADIRTVDLYIEALLAKEQADVAALGTREQQDISATLGALASGLSALRAGEQADIGALRTSLTGTINADVNALNQTLQSDVLNLNNRITSVQTVLAQKEATDVRSLQAADATNLRTAENFATSLFNSVGLGAITSRLNALQSQVSQIKTETDECLTPLCDTVTPQAKRLGNVGKILQGLEGLALVAFLMALTEEALTSPEAVVEDTVSVFNAVLGPFVAGFKDAVGA